MILRQLMTLGRRQIGRRQPSALSTASSSRPAPSTPSSSSSTLNGVRHLSSTSTTDVAHSPPSSPTARSSKDGVVGEPIDFDVSSKIEGNESQVSKVLFYCKCETYITQLASFVFINLSYLLNFTLYVAVDYHYFSRAWPSPSCRIRCYDVHDGVSRELRYSKNDQDILSHGAGNLKTEKRFLIFCFLFLFFQGSYDGYHNRVSEEEWLD
jgi:hypothetical protein